MLQNWFFVYLRNFIGAMIVVLRIQASGQFDFSAGAMGGYTIKMAAGKTSISFLNAFFMGILRNCIVCSAVGMAATADDTIGKIFYIFFPTWLFVTSGFVTSGFEHSIGTCTTFQLKFLPKATTPGTRLPSAWAYRLRRSFTSTGGGVCGEQASSSYAGQHRGLRDLCGLLVLVCLPQEINKASIACCKKPNPLGTLAPSGFWNCLTLLSESLLKGSHRITILVLHIAKRRCY